MAKKRESSEKTSEFDASKDMDSASDSLREETEKLTSEEDASVSGPDERARCAPEEDVKTAERYLRLAAEFENYKKRIRKDQAEYVKYANERLLKDLLPVLDNLQRALRHVQQGGNVTGLVQGVELTCKQYVETLSRFGVKPIPSVGLPFDPSIHQAVAMVNGGDGQAPNTIVEEYEKGYYLYDRVLRPAMVSVVAPTSNAGSGDVASH